MTMSVVRELHLSLSVLKIHDRDSAVSIRLVNALLGICLFLIAG